MVFVTGPFLPAVSAAVARAAVPSLPALCTAAAVSAAIGGLAWRGAALSRSGALTATLLGTVALSTGRAWGGFLVSWFVLTAALSRMGHVRKARHVAGVVQKGGARDAPQVLVNGGVFTAGALATWWLGGEAAGWAPVAATAALAAAGADTWATEAGTWAAARAWSLRTRRWVAAGTSGAVTLPGTLALLAGALCWAGAAVLLGLVPTAAWHAVALGGVGGATVDTLLGALAQQRRWCDHCECPTEQHTHACGQPTRYAGGLRWLDNDLVNLAATVAGALIAVGAMG
jgi:uncharacterized protein (TIGR00297 family)